MTVRQNELQKSCGIKNLDSYLGRVKKNEL